MPADIEIQLDKAQMARAMALLAAIPKGYKTAASRAINETETSTRYEAIKKITEATGMQSSHARKGFLLSKAKYGRLWAMLSVTYEKRPLIGFGARQVKHGVKVAEGHGERTLIPRAFIATMPSGHKGVFKRICKSRLPIVELMGPSVSWAYQNTPGVIELVEKDSAPLLEKKLARNIDVLLAKHAEKTGAAA